MLAKTFEEVIEEFNSLLAVAQSTVPNFLAYDEDRRKGLEAAMLILSLTHALKQANTIGITLEDQKERAGISVLKKDNSLHLVTASSVFYLGGDNELRWFLRDLSAAVRCLLAARLIRLIAPLLLGAPKQLGSDQLPLVADCDWTEMNWQTWQGSMWSEIDLIGFSDEQLTELGEIFDKACFGSHVCEHQANVAFCQWLKERTIGELFAWNVSPQDYKQIRESVNSARGPGMDVLIQFDVETQQFRLVIPIKAHTGDGGDIREQCRLPQTLLNQFLKDTNDQARAAMFRLIVRAFDYKAGTLASDVCESDAY